MAYLTETVKGQTCVSLATATVLRAQKMTLLYFGYYFEGHILVIGIIDGEKI